ncbi:MAG: hypothetical protein MZU95_04125 [Desulfomicrobium escambiense]|nr:hypothetical protein [Desulfomicrobium escambiense]
MNKHIQGDFGWAERFSDRGVELCKTFKESGIDVFRYYCYYTKNILEINSPYKSRSPCLQIFANELEKFFKNTGNSNKFNSPVRA